MASSFKFSFPCAPGAAKGFQRFQNFRHVRWLGAGKLCGEIGGRNRRGGGVQGGFYRVHPFW